MDLKDWLSAAEARCERASKGPWRTERRSVFADNPSRYIAEMQRAVELSCLRDAEFIAAARSDLPRALALLRKALEIVDDYRRVSDLVGEVDAEIMQSKLAAFDAAVNES